MKDYNYEYKDHCLTCEYYNPTKNWSEINSSKGFYCSKHGWQDPYDKCSSYRNGYYSNSYLDDCMEEYKKKKRYYIVTTVCSLMGLPEDNEYRSMFARTIEEYLIGTKDGEQLLADYDYYGRLVADLMEIEYYRGNKDAVIELMTDKIIPEFDKMLKDINENRANHAMLRYIVMTRKLMERYEINYYPMKSLYEETEYSPLNNTLLAYKRTK